MHSIRKGDNAIFLQQSGWFLSLHPRWRVLSRKRDQTRETRAICDQEITSRVCITGWPIGVGGSQGPAKSGQGWSRHPGLRSGCILYRQPAGQGKPPISVWLPWREILFRL